MGTIDLFQAIRLNKSAAIIEVIKTININQLNEFGQNPLYEAVVENNLKIAELLIANGINVNHQEKKGQTPLHYAALYKTTEIAEKILENGGKIHIADDYGNEPLWTAVFNARGEYNIVKIFLRHGANAHHKNNSNRSPYDFAVQIKDEKLLELLV